MSKTEQSLLFYELFPSYAFIVPANGQLYHSDFLEALKTCFDCENNERNKIFYEAAKQCDFLSITRFCDKFQINF